MKFTWIIIIKKTPPSLGKHKESLWLRLYCNFIFSSYATQESQGEENQLCLVFAFSFTECNNHVHSLSLPWQVSRNYRLKISQTQISTISAFNLKPKKKESYQVHLRVTWELSKKYWFRSHPTDSDLGSVQCGLHTVVFKSHQGLQLQKSARTSDLHKRPEGSWNEKIPKLQRFRFWSQHPCLIFSVLRQVTECLQTSIFPSGKQILFLAVLTEVLYGSNMIRKC